MAKTSLFLFFYLYRGPDMSSLEWGRREGVGAHKPAMHLNPAMPSKGESCGRADVAVVSISR